MTKDDNLISLKEAAAIYKAVTGQTKSLKVMDELIHGFRHLASFDFSLEHGRPKFVGVRRDRFTYFVKIRFALYGRRGIFYGGHDDL